MIASHTWRIWSVAALCVTVVLGAMSFLTVRFLDQRSQDLQQGAEAYKQERVRLAMWRLDTLATSIVGAEDLRSAEELYSAEFREIMEHQLGNDSPVANVYANPPAYSNLYWTVTVQDEERLAKSSQVYEEDYLISNRVNRSYNIAHSDKLKEFNGILGSPVKWGETMRGAKSDVTNFDLMCKSCHELPFAESVKPKIEVVADNNDFSLPALNLDAPAPNKNSKIVQYKNAPEVQGKISKAEKGKRQQAVNRLQGNYMNPEQWGVANQMVQQVEAPNTQVYEIKTSKFSPIWLDDELVLVRRVQVMGLEKFQGVWMNKQEVVGKLLTEISDLFPKATLVPYQKGDAASQQENAMVKLPFLLVPEEIESSIFSSVTAMDLVRGPVGLAWVGVVLAIVAGFVMLRSVIRMSERRASFVSSVTHELRTPLTTFRLYSDMLSSGLVKSEEAKQNYLETLKRESDRLTHLVENVLSYSRIERGSARAKVESISVGELLGRCEERFKARAEEDGLGLEIKIYDSDKSDRVEVDTTGVEQILFNLIDNAAKYASGDGCGDRLTLSAELKGSMLMLSLCDQGKGVSRKELKRLFKPFHKSAEQAANTKPGVGLGLALCRRLARAMKGDLYYKKIEGGSCFVLEVPQSRG